MAPHIQLRDVIPEDLPTLFEQQLDPVAAEMAAFPSRERGPFMAHWAKILADPTVVAQTILADGQIAGNMGCWEQDGERDVGYWLGREYWGNGIATAALAAFLTQLPQRPLHARVVSHNHASRRVLEKCGFVAVGMETDASTPGAIIEEIIMRLG
jgi:RimJ/RimL family protein N-acetyltransferase